MDNKITLQNMLLMFYLSIFIQRLPYFEVSYQILFNQIGVKTVRKIKVLYNIFQTIKI